MYEVYAVGGTHPFLLSPAGWVWIVFGSALLLCEIAMICVGIALILGQ